MTAPSRSRLLGTIGSLVVVLAALLAAAPAIAHTDLADTDPAADATLEQPPRTVRLTFTETISEDFADATIRVGDSKPITVRSTVAGRGLLLTIPPELRADTVPGDTGWRVSYRVVSRDGHPITGSYGFVVRSTSASSSAPTPRPSPTQRTSESASASPTGSSPPSATGPTESGNAWASTVIIGGLAAFGAVTAAIWLARRRREETEE